MARGSIVKRPSGNYAIVYYVDGKQKWETIGPSRREAERALTARKREVDTGSWREPSTETLTAYAERWLERRNPARVSGAARTRLSPSTFEGYRLNLRRHVLPRLGQRALASLRTEDVDRLIAELEERAGGAGLRLRARDTAPALELPAAPLGTCPSPRRSRGRGLPLPRPASHLRIAARRRGNPVITLKRYAHLLDARVTEAAARFDPARVTEPEART